jgi:hypothetical protein
MRRLLWIAAALAGLSACVDPTDGAPSFSVRESEGAYGNPHDTPLSDRRIILQSATGIVTMSPIPGESGMSSNSSVLSGGGSGGGGGGSGGGGR